MFAKLAMTELRAKQGVCSGSCTTYHCYKVNKRHPMHSFVTSPVHPLLALQHPLLVSKHCIVGLQALPRVLFISQARLQPTIAALRTTWASFGDNHAQGGPAEPPEGLETLGCPLYSHPAQLVDNRNCVLCMTCLKVR